MTKKARAFRKRKKGHASNDQSGRGFGDWGDWLSSFDYGSMLSSVMPDDVWRSPDKWAEAKNNVNPAIFKAMLLTSARFVLTSLYPKWAPYPSLPESTARTNRAMISQMLRNPRFWARVGVGMPLTMSLYTKLTEPVNGVPPPAWVVLPAGLAMLSWHMYQALPENRDEDNGANAQPPPPYAPPPVPLQPAVQPVVQPVVQSEEQKRRDEAAMEDARRVREFIARQVGSGKKRKLSHNFSKLAKTCLCPTKRLKLSLRP